MLHVRNSANVYWLTAKGRAASNDWQPMGTAPRNRFIELRGRIDTARPKEQVYRASFNHHFGCYATTKGNQIAATAWREVTP